MINACFTRSIYSLPRKYMSAILAVCDDADFAKIVVIGHWRFTVWTKYDPVAIDKL